MQFNLPTLNGRITWDTSQLYTTGVLTVAATYYAGDFNRDGHVDAADILPMETALTDAADYETTKGLNASQLLLIGDVNGDGKFNNTDVQAFLNLLQSGGGSNDPVPEPSSLVLAMLAVVGMLFVGHCRD
ncbi:MAG TPA: dockerin type I domain-containing protein [Pirellulales bacterium]|jgi:hypothetical protein|nr:dockerin type I domain-containing protein [Pirellulales bacterium]